MTNTALRREAAEELGISGFTPEPLATYVFESSREKELVFSHQTVYDGVIIPGDEVVEGRFWTLHDIRENIGKGVFTPNFEDEFYRFLSDSHLSSKKKPKYL